MMASQLTTMSSHSCLSPLEPIRCIPNLNRDSILSSSSPWYAKSKHDSRHMCVRFSDRVRLQVCCYCTIAYTLPFLWSSNSKPLESNTLLSLPHPRKASRHWIIKRPTTTKTTTAVAQPLRHMHHPQSRASHDHVLASLTYHAPSCRTVLYLPSHVICIRSDPIPCHHTETTLD
jgi:hypothetical protein